MAYSVVIAAGNLHGAQCLHCTPNREYQVRAIVFYRYNLSRDTMRVDIHLFSSQSIEAMYMLSCILHYRVKQLGQHDNGALATSFTTLLMTICYCCFCIYALSARRHRWPLNQFASSCSVHSSIRSLYLKREKKRRKNLLHHIQCIVCVRKRERKSANALTYYYYY